MIVIGLISSTHSIISFPLAPGENGQRTSIDYDIILYPFMRGSINELAVLGGDSKIF